MVINLQMVHSGIDINTNALDFQWLYRLAVEEVPEHDYMLPLSEAEVSYCYLFFGEFRILNLKKVTNSINT